LVTNRVAEWGLVSGTLDRNINIWNSTGSLKSTIEGDQIDKAVSVAVLQNGDLAVGYINSNYSIKIWNLLL